MKLPEMRYLSMFLLFLSSCPYFSVCSHSPITSSPVTNEAAAIHDNVTQASNVSSTSSEIKSKTLAALNITADKGASNAADLTQPVDMRHWMEGGPVSKAHASPERHKTSARKGAPTEKPEVAPGNHKTGALPGAGASSGAVASPGTGASPATGVSPAGAKPEMDVKPVFEVTPVTAGKPEDVQSQAKPGIPDKSTTPVAKPGMPDKNSTPAAKPGTGVKNETGAKPETVAKPDASAAKTVKPVSNAVPGTGVKTGTNAAHDAKPGSDATHDAKHETDVTHDAKHDTDAMKLHAAKPEHTNHTSATSSTNTTVRPMKPSFTMVKGDKYTKTSESFIESSTTGKDYVLPIVLSIFAVPAFVFLVKFLYRRGTEFTERQQYHRMYLIDGMYNTR